MGRTSWNAVVPARELRKTLLARTSHGPNLSDSPSEPMLVAQTSPLGTSAAITIWISSATMRCLTVVSPSPPVQMMRPS
jgi:hypothetical protein